MGLLNVNLESSQCVKYLLFVLNFCFVVTGIILIATGSSIQGNYSSYKYFLEGQFFSIPTLLITVGIIIFIVAFFGCYGAIRENYCMILTFAALMILIFILELFAGIYGYVLRGSVAEIVERKMNKSMQLYAVNGSEDISSLWDSIQRQFGCCGTEYPKDWLKAWKISNRTELADKSYLPLSCCKLTDGIVGEFTCDLADKKPVFYDKGCLTEFAEFIQSHALQLGGFGLGIAFCQALGIWFALFLAKTIKKSYLNM